MTALVRQVPAALFALLLAASAAADGAGQVLHLAIGDPARKDREVPLQLDTITDTKTGEAIVPADLVTRLAGVRLLLIGEEHTNIEIHRVQARVIRALHDAGRRVFIGLEMYPYPWQPSLDEWTNGLLTEEGFLRLSHWYDNWGYHWNYYRDVFVFARDNHIPMFALNAPRDVVAAVRRKGFANLTPEEAAHIPKDIDTSNPDHMTFFKATFADATGGAMIHAAGMSDDMWKAMLSAQATWDATMGFHAVQALKQPGAADAIMVVLVGSGHVAYGLGIEHQARQWFDGPIASIIPMEVSDNQVPIKTVRASYANFLWGLPEEIDSLYPSLGISTRAIESGKALQVLAPEKDSLAAKAGFKENDVLVSMDGVPIPDKETLNRLAAGKRWGDAAVFVIRRGAETETLTMNLRRSLPKAAGSTSDK
jgi:aminopeptidase N